MAPSQRAAAAAGSQFAPAAYAGLQLRIVAFILDILVLISFGMLFGAAIGAFLVVDSNLHDGNPPDRDFLIVGGIVALYFLAFAPLYFVLLWSWWGQTVGMMAVHIKVIRRDGGRLSLGRSAVRLLGCAASVLPLFLGLAIALFDRERRTLHDHLAGTIVLELP